MSAPGRAGGALGALSWRCVRRLARCQGGARIIAFVASDNLRSQNLFESCGFRRSNDADERGLIRYSLNPPAQAEAAQWVDLEPNNRDRENRRIGPGHEPYVICELSGNHNGSLERALKLLEEAAATEADAIKIQTYTRDTITIDHDGPGFRIEGGLWDGRTLYELYGERRRRSNGTNPCSIARDSLE